MDDFTKFDRGDGVANLEIYGSETPPAIDMT